jgi:hypothetical protein
MSGVLYPAARDSIQRGSISIALGVGRHEVTCEATAPSGFVLRGNAPYLNRNTLRVLAQRSVRVEMWDSTGAVIAITVADPAAVRPATIRW